MQIYVESRGFAQDDDYHWLEVTQENQKLIEKEDLPNILLDAIQLIDSEDFSLVLSRQNNQLLLLVTGLKTEGRIDFVERQIRISVAWIAEYSKSKESAFSILASSALKDEKCKFLTEKISQAVIMEEHSGWLVDYLKIAQLVNGNGSQKILLDRTPNLTKKIAQISPEKKQELAEEIESYSLPNESVVLVVVTGIKKEETLVKAGVWRGLSSLINEKDWHPIPIVSPDENNSNKLFEYLIRLASIFGIMSLMELVFKAFSIVPMDKTSNIENSHSRKNI